MLNICCKTVPMEMPEDLTEDQLTLVQEMA